jgi:hypothetical protein
LGTSAFMFCDGDHMVTTELVFVTP